MLRRKEIPDFVYDPSCVLYLPLWKRDGLTFTSDDAYGHLATVTDATHGIQGRTFNGTSAKIAIPFHSSFNIATELTITFWVKYDVLTGDRCELFLGDLSGAWVFRRLDGQSFGIYSAGWEYLAVATGFSTGAWYQVTLTYDTAKLVSYYVNGALVTSTTFTKSLPTIDAGLTIANETDTASFGSTFLDGTFGEVWLNNRALTQLEIQHDMLATKWRYQ